MSERTVLFVEVKRSGHSAEMLAMENAGFQIVWVGTGKAALAAARSKLPDLVIFNASQMRSNGVRSCSRIRRAVDKVPIIHIRAAGQPEELEAGADVYLERPFTPRKLLNRVKALLPPDLSKEEIVCYGNITYYRTKGSVRVEGKGESRLTPKLAHLLEEFLRHPNEIVTRKQLMQNVWNTDYIGDTRTLDVHVRWVRELIELDPAFPRRLQTVRGKGYILLPDR